MTNKKLLSSQEIRVMFLDYFSSKGHKILASSSLVPHGDPSLLFTNAGMNQFKDTFLGFEKRSYTTAATSQKCVRAGGKHNDLENVGYTTRHHTFFEMLGNFSFGDYFKKEAITYAWELLTQVYQIPKEKLLVTVYTTDQEAYDIWTKIIKLPKEKIIQIGDNRGSKYASDNFWMMGDTGPCGPCSEIFYDHGKDIPGGPPGSENDDGDRFIEIWNLVFMQYNRDENGVMHQLPKPSVDTGMGLERITAILQNVHSNYEIDIFQGLIKAAANVTKTNNLNHTSLKVLADHIRATTFLILDGVIPTNEGRGYVLRRIIRRAIRHGYKLGCRTPFFNQLASPLMKLMGDTYKATSSQIQRIISEITLEEERFFTTIENGMTILERSINTTKQNRIKELSGSVAFKLHDTFGFPLDLTADICRENNLVVNEKEFTEEMDAQRNRARQAGNFKNKKVLNFNGPDTLFTGYSKIESEALIQALYKKDNVTDYLSIDEEGIIILDQTPFYAESGGQVGDIGLIKNKNSEFVVTDTYKIKGLVYGHYGYVKSGQFNLTDKVTASINAVHRSHIKRNHSATHLLHKALKLVLGDHVEQKGSLVDDTKTRFDFSHPKQISEIQINEIELIVNNEILKNQDTQSRIMPIDEAQKIGAMMLFGEKYNSEVRVLDIGNSRELCGGTHVSKTGDIGLFKIQTESSISAGIRRIEAVTGFNLINMVDQQEEILSKLAKELNSGIQDLPSKIKQLLMQIKENEKNLNQLKSKIASNQGDNLINKAIIIKTFKFLAETVDNQGPNELRGMIDKLKEKLKTAVIILAAIEDQKITFAVGVSDDLTNNIDAGAIAKILGKETGGKGGGRKNMAMAGGSNPNLIPKALKIIKDNLSN